MLVKDIIDKFGGKLIGDAERVIKGPSNIEEATVNTITFLDNKVYRKYLKNIKDVTIIISKEDYFEELSRDNSVIIVEKPQIYYGMVLTLFDTGKNVKPFISEYAYISKSAQLGENVTIFPHVYIGDNVKIGNNVRIFPNTTVLSNCSIGDDSVIMSNVKLYYNTKIGKNCYIDQGASIGSRGFGFPKDKNGHTNEIPQIGNVIIKDNVYVGANTTIDRATTASTIIGENTKIDNLVQIAHNVNIGKETIIISQVGIAGSTKIGDYVIIAAQTGIIGHIKIGNHVIVGAKSGVTKSIPDSEMWSGAPARPHFKELKKEVLINKLPEIYKKIMEVINEREKRD